MSAPVRTPANDIGMFADRVLGRPLWDYQLDFCSSPARYRVVCAGRQVGKSVSLSTIALFEASTRADILVLIVSAGEDAAKRLLADCADTAANSPMLSGSVLDSTMSTLTLSNGSVIRSVPASIRQIRGWAVDVLIVDEAGFVSMDVWQSAEPAIIARPGSKVILCSSPWGDAEHFFRSMWQQGMESPSERLRAWHWPSSVSPLVDQDFLEHKRNTETAEYFAREYLAEWTSESGAYFTEEELAGAIADYALLSPDDALARGPYITGPGRIPVFPGVAGVDWGQARDANAMVIVSPLEDYGANIDNGRWTFFVPWLEARYLSEWDAWIDHVAVTATSRYRLDMIAAEINGVGSYPTEALQTRVHRLNSDPGLSHTLVSRVWTDVRWKQSAFGKVKLLLQRRQLVLPNHPELLKQLRCTEFEALPSGATRIAVPERRGHDDLAMALVFAVACLRTEDPYISRRDPDAYDDAVPVGESLLTPGGIRIPAQPVPSRLAGSWWFQWAKGGEREGAGW